MAKNSPPPPPSAEEALHPKPLLDGITEMLHVQREGAGLPDDDDDGPVLMHDDFRQIITDVVGSHSAVGVLSRLLKTSDAEAMAEADASVGLGVLLEGVHARLALALDNLSVAADALNIEVRG